MTHLRQRMMEPGTRSAQSQTAETSTDRLEPGRGSSPECLLDAQLVTGPEGVALPSVVIAIEVLILQIESSIVERCVALDPVVDSRRTPTTHQNPMPQVLVDGVALDGVVVGTTHNDNAVATVVVHNIASDRVAAAGVPQKDPNAAI